MQYKKQLAVRIVTDFHSAEAAARAEVDWAKQFQRDEVPEDVEHVSVAYADVGPGTGFGRLDADLPKAKSGLGFERLLSPHDAQPIKLEKLLARAGFVTSATDGVRKIKANAVRIDGEIQSKPYLHLKIPAEITIRVGKQMKKVFIS
jgi:tyrosyl-tRNA synthetase